MSGPFLDLRRLRYFQAVTVHGSVTAASRAINIAQPALSYHIAELERSLGMPIFDRSVRGVSLTPGGKLLIQHAEIILRDVGIAERELRGLSERLAPSTSITLGMNSGISASLTPLIVGAARRDLPEIDVRIRELLAQQCFDMVARGDIDISVTFADHTVPGAIPVGWERLFLVSSPTSAKDDRKPIPFSDVCKRQLILPSKQKRLRQILESKAVELGHRLNVTAEVDGVEPRREAVRAGLGSTVLPWINIGRECDAGTLVARPIRDPILRRRVVMLVRNGLDPATATALREVVVAVLRSIGQSPGLGGAHTHGQRGAA